MAKKKSKSSSKKPTPRKPSGKKGRKPKVAVPSPTPPSVAPSGLVSPATSVPSPKAPRKKGKSAKGKARKPSKPNRYNIIRSAISSYYATTVGRRVKGYEIKVIYSWIQETYGSNPVRYVTSSIDIILDLFWQEYCNLYPVDIANFTRVMEWFHLKNILVNELDLHYPTDIIQINLDEIAEAPIEFFMQDYSAGWQDYYQTCKNAGIKTESPPPTLILESAYCDISKRGNLFKYRLSLTDDMPSVMSTTPIVTPTPTPEMPVEPIVTSPITESTTTPIVTSPIPVLTPEQVMEVEIQKERVRAEYGLKQQKLQELSELLKKGIITFEQYMEAIKSI